MPDETVLPEATSTWTRLVRAHGRTCVVSLHVDEATLDLETARQASVIFPLLDPLLTGEVTALDYGCGAGRFTHALAAATGCLTTGYDPCAEFADHWKDGPEVDFTSDISALVPGSYEIVFAALVIGDPSIDDIEAAAAGLVSLMAPGGLLVLIDHMTPDEEKRWWQFRVPSFYLDLFARHGVTLRALGQDKQLDVPITILGGRKER